MTRWFLDRTPQAGAPSVCLRRLLPEAQVVGAGNLRVAGCSADPGKLDPGQWYVAVGAEWGEDGHGLVATALERGAAGLVVDRPLPDSGRLQVVVGDVRSAHARISQALAGDPAGSLPVVGVTGASGKGAVGSFLRAIFRAEGQVVGSVGATSWFDGDAIRPVGPRSPDAPQLAAMLASMVYQRCDSAVLEVDHEAIDRREADGITLAAVVVTNLGDEDPADRRRTYARLIRRIEPGGAVVIDADDPAADVLGAGNLRARRVTFGIDEDAAADPKANVSAVVDQISATSARFVLRGFDRDIEVSLRVGGGHAVIRQALAAAAVAWSIGVSADVVVRGLESVARIPGHFEPIRAGQPFEVRVDQARTAGSLARALASLRALTPGRVICVLGAEGTRRDDATPLHTEGGRFRRRVALGRAAEAGADLVILTTDNPHAEDPNAITDEIRAGMTRPGQARLELHRRDAITFALACAQPGDGVLIAGKGSRAYQIYADRVASFDDAAVAAQILRDFAPAAGRATA